MDPKLTILFCLIGTIIGLSHLSGENLTKLKRQIDGAHPSVSGRMIVRTFKTDGNHR
jgi:hypothetical protein